MANVRGRRGFTQANGRGGHMSEADAQAAKDRAAEQRANKIETERQILAHMVTDNVHGLGADISALGATTATGIHTTNDFADVSAAGGGMGRVVSPRSASPANTEQYSPTVKTTPGIIVPSQGLNGDIVDLGFNAMDTGIEPIGMGGQGYYSGGTSGRSIRKPVTADTSMFGGEFTPVAEDFSVGGPQSLGPVFTESGKVWVRGPDGNMIEQTQFTDVTGTPTPGYKGGLVTRDEGGQGYTDAFIRAGSLTADPSMTPWAIGQRQSQELKDLRAEQEAERQATLRLISEEGDDDPTPTKLRDSIPPTGSWANIPGAGAFAYMSDVSDRLVTPTELGTQQREALEAVSEKGDMPPDSGLTPWAIGKRQVWELEQAKKGILNSGFY